MGDAVRHANKRRRPPSLIISAGACHDHISGFGCWSGDRGKPPATTSFPKKYGLYALISTHYQDGFILATVLQHPSVTLKTLPEALKVYDEIRRPFAIDIQRRSKLNGHLYQFNALGCEKITAEQCSAGGIPSERLKEIGDKITSLVEWTVTGTAMDERRKALAFLDNLKV